MVLYSIYVAGIDDVLCNLGFIVNLCFVVPSFIEGYRFVKVCKFFILSNDGYVDDVRSLLFDDD